MTIMTIKLPPEKKDWNSLTTLERAIRCEQIAEYYRPGYYKDQVLALARQLREMAGRKNEIKKINNGRVL